MGSGVETMFVTLGTFFRSTASQGFQNTKWPAVLVLVRYSVAQTTSCSYKNIREIVRFMCKVRIYWCQFTTLSSRQIFRKMLNILFEWSLFSDVSFTENQPRKTLLAVLSSYADIQVFMNWRHDHVISKVSQTINLLGNHLLFYENR